jgi:hypothetical protein
MKWISVEDKLPPQVCRVLVAKWDGRKGVNMHFIFIASRLDSGWVDDLDGELIASKYGTVTHWMPLPDVPAVMEKVV